MTQYETDKGFRLVTARTDGGCLNCNSPHEAGDIIYASPAFTVCSKVCLNMVNGYMSDVDKTAHYEVKP